MSDAGEELERAMPAKGATVARGAQRVWDPRVWGTMVGAVGATVFVLSNRTELMRPWPATAILAWAGGLAAGLVLGWFWYQPAAPAAAVLAGLVMLAVLAVDAARTMARRA